MGFKNGHAPSTISKVMLVASILTGSLASALVSSGNLEWTGWIEGEVLEGNGYRVLIMLSCCLIYVARFASSMFVFVQRKIGWFEGSFVSVLYFMMFYSFGLSAGSSPDPLGVFDYLGVLLFCLGSYINSWSEYQRFLWKRDSRNKGRLYTAGLFRHSMHVNYFGDALTYFGLAFIAMDIVCHLISFGIVLNFIALQIPMLDKHLASKYGDEFVEYAARSKKFVPFVY